MSLTALKGLTAVMTAGSTFYSVSWLLGRVDSGVVLHDFFAVPKEEKFSARDIFLYKNYILGLLLTPNLSLLAAFWRGTSEALGMAALTAALANGLYSLHLTTTPDATIFLPKIRVSAAVSHAVTALVCAYGSWTALGDQR